MNMCLIHTQSVMEAYWLQENTCQLTFTHPLILKQHVAFKPPSWSLNSLFLQDTNRLLISLFVQDYLVGCR